jgi:hypothetical protein
MEITYTKKNIRKACTDKLVRDIIPLKNPVYCTDIVVQFYLLTDVKYTALV